MVDYRSAVSIAEIVFYAIALPINVYLAVRHGFGRNGGWVYLVVFAIIRILGAALQLATISNPTSTSLYTGAAILSSVGVSPLFLATLGLLGRVGDSIKKSNNVLVQSTYLRLVQMIITVAAILAIVGGTKSGNDFSKTGKFTTQTITKVAIILYIVSYAAIVFFTILTAVQTSDIERGQKRLLLAVGLSLPFLAARLIYAILISFVNNSTFNLLTGSVTALLCIAVLEEFAVVLIYNAFGVTLRVVPNSEMPQSSGSNGGLARFARRLPITGMILNMTSGSGRDEPHGSPLQDRYASKPV